MSRHFLITAFPPTPESCRQALALHHAHPAYPAAGMPVPAAVRRAAGRYCLRG